MQTDAQNPFCFRLMDTGQGSAAFNMALDEALAVSVRGGAMPVIRFYGWEHPALSLGRFQRDLEGFHPGFIRESGMDAVVRPTGGRAVLHLPSELTCSVCCRFEGVFSGKNLFECYRIIGSAISRALKRLGADVEMRRKRRNAGVKRKSAHCFQSVSYAEITSGGRKLVGSAQRRWPDGFLQQGSIPFEIDAALQEKVFKGFDPMAMAGVSEIVPRPAGQNPAERGLSHLRETLKGCLTEEFGAVLGAALLPSWPAPPELALARDLLPAYGPLYF